MFNPENSALKAEEVKEYRIPEGEQDNIPADIYDATKYFAGKSETLLKKNLEELAKLKINERKKEFLREISFLNQQVDFDNDGYEKSREFLSLQNKVKEMIEEFYEIRLDGQSQDNLKGINLLKDIKIWILGETHTEAEEEIVMSYLINFLTKKSNKETNTIMLEVDPLDLSSDEDIKSIISNNFPFLEAVKNLDKVKIAGWDNSYLAEKYSFLLHKAIEEKQLEKAKQYLYDLCLERNAEAINKISKIIGKTDRVIVIAGSRHIKSQPTWLNEVEYFDKVKKDFVINGKSTLALIPKDEIQENSQEKAIEENISEIFKHKTVDTKLNEKIVEKIKKSQNKEHYWDKSKKMNEYMTRLFALTDLETLAEIEELFHLYEQIIFRFPRRSTMENAYITNMVGKNEKGKTVHEQLSDIAEQKAKLKSVEEHINSLLYLDKKNQSLSEEEKAELLNFKENISVNLSLLEKIETITKSQIKLAEESFKSMEKAIFTDDDIENLGFYDYEFSKEFDTNEDLPWKYPLKKKGFVQFVFYLDFYKEFIEIQLGNNVVQQLRQDLKDARYDID